MLARTEDQRQNCGVPAPKDKERRSLSSALPGQHEQFYVVGGNLHPDAPSYVRRQADDDLYDARSRGEFCYILTSRQMGKSSLIVRTGARLAQDGVRVATIDLRHRSESHA